MGGSESLGNTQRLTPNHLGPQSPVTPSCQAGFPVEECIGSRLSGPLGENFPYLFPAASNRLGSRACQMMEAGEAPLVNTLSWKEAVM